MEPVRDRNNLRPRAKKRPLEDPNLEKGVKRVEIDKGVKKGENDLHSPTTPKERERIKKLLNYDLDKPNLSLIFTFIKSIASGDISPTLAADCLRTKYVSVYRSSTLIFRILDCLGFILDEVKNKKNLELFLESLERYGVTTTREIVAAIDAYKLDACGYSSGLTAIAIRERTRNQFVLKVHGLWRECPIGYDLLNQLLYFYRHPDISKDQHLNITEVNKPSSKDYDHKRTGITRDKEDEYMIREINRIFGVYSLCPTRMLYEVILWCCITKSLEFSIRLLSSYPEDKVQEMIFLILKHYDNIKKDSPYQDRFYFVADGLYQLIAKLILLNKLSIDKLYGYLDPPDSTFTLVVNQFVKSSKQRPIIANRAALPIPVLKAIASAPIDDSMTLPEAIESFKSGVKLDRYTVIMAKQLLKERVNIGAGSNNDGTNKSVNNIGKSELLATERTAGTTAESGRNESSILSSLYSFGDNYVHVRDCIYSMMTGKILLLSSIIDLINDTSSKDWKIARRLINHYKLLQFPVYLSGHITRAICRLMLKMIQKKGTLTLDELEYFLTLLGPNLYVDQIAFAKVLKILNNCLSEKERVLPILYNSILPALMLSTEGNSQIGDRVWKILSQLSVSDRYCVYFKYISTFIDVKLSSVYDCGILLVNASHSITCLKTRSIFKRVTSNMLKNNKNAAVRGIVSLVTGMASINPFAIVDVIISQCEMFENLVAPLSEVSKYFSKLTCDVFYFRLCCNQFKTNTTANVDEIGRSRKLFVNTQLAARIFKRHTNSDITPLLLFILLSLNNAINNSTLKFKSCAHESEEKNKTRGSLRTKLWNEGIQIALYCVVFPRLATGISVSASLRYTYLLHTFVTFYR